MNIAAHYLDIFRATPDAKAVVSARNQAHTFGDLLRDVDVVRSAIRQTGLARGAHVVLQLPAGRHFVAWAVALASEGMVAVGIDLAHGPDVYRDRAKAANADAVVCTRLIAAVQRANSVVRSSRISALIPPALDVPQMVSRLDDERVNAGVNRHDDPVEVDAEDLAFIIFTGGTTSIPKGVRLSHRAVRAYVDALAAIPEWDEIRSFVADQPQQVMYGLAHNKTVYVAPVRSERHSQVVADLLFCQGVDAYFGSPTRWTRILDTDLLSSSHTSPRAVLLGGATVTPTILSRLCGELPETTSIRCIYGMTEVGPVSHCDGREKLARDQGSGDFVGELFPNVDASISADGELSVSTPARFSGYLHADDGCQTEPFLTGDQAHLVDGQLTLTGRSKEMIVADGVNLYPGQFEARLRSLEIDGRAIFSDVALVGVTVDRLGDERFVLFYRHGYDGDAVDPADALLAASSLFPEDLAPVRAINLAEFPVRGRQGKVDRSELGRIADQAIDEPSVHEQRERLLAEMGDTGVSRIRLTPVKLLTDRNLRWASQLPDADNPAGGHIFIVGHQRSGTTAMHRALSASSTAAAFTIGDMLVPRPVTWKVLRRVSPLFDRLTKGLRSRKPSTRVANIDAKHSLEFSAPEEEEWLFAALGVSGYLPSACEETLGDDTFGWVRRRDEWPSTTLDELFDLYARISSYWRQSLGLSESTTIIAKNPAFGPTVVALSDHFLDSRFVVMLRDPHEAITSRLELIRAIHGRPLRQPEEDVIVADSVHQMEQMAIGVRKLAQDRVVLVDAGAFRVSPKATVLRVARELDLELSERSEIPTTGPSSQTQIDPHSSDSFEIEGQLTEYIRLFQEVRP